MFKDSRARRTWRLYFLKAEVVLSPLSTSVRRELINDLKSHVREILIHQPLEGDENTRLLAALDRVGSPKEFVAPLLADAVFRAPQKNGSLGMVGRTLSLYAARGTSHLVRAVGLVAAWMTGIVVGIAAFNSLVRPNHAGLFQLSEDEYQLRVLGLGSSAGEQLLQPWMAVALIALGLALIAWSVRHFRKILVDLIAASA